jgi:hypothetical protein
MEQYTKKAYTRVVNGKTIPVRESKVKRNTLLTIGALGTLGLGIYGGYRGIKKVKSIVDDAEYVVKTAKQKVDTVDMQKVNETLENIKKISQNIKEGSTKVNNTLDRIPFTKKTTSKPSLGRRAKEMMWRNMGKSDEWISNNKYSLILHEFKGTSEGAKKRWEASKSLKSNYNDDENTLGEAFANKGNRYPTKVLGAATGYGIGKGIGNLGLASIGAYEDYQMAIKKKPRVEVEIGKNHFRNVNDIGGGNYKNLKKGLRYGGTALGAYLAYKGWKMADNNSRKQDYIDSIQDYRQYRK